MVLKSSDISVDRVDDARKVLSQGDEIEVKLTNVDSKNGTLVFRSKPAIDEERQAVRDHKKKEDVKVVQLRLEI